MRTLHLSVAHHDEVDMADLYRQLADPTFGKLDAKLAIDVIAWEELWHFVQTKAITRTGLDVSEVGTTWIGSLADTGALKPLSGELIETIGGREIFSNTAWQSIKHISNNLVLFLPLMLDVRVIYYWRDHLEAAGIDEESAFSSMDLMHETMATLTEEGFPGWGAPTFLGINTLYHISSWIWATGKDYLSEDGKQTKFCDADVLDAILSYFRLSEFMNRTFEAYGDVSLAFREKKISAFMSGPWVWAYLYKNKYPETDLANIGIALPPGPPFLGGSTLVLWNHADERIVDAAVALMKGLVSPDCQKALFDARGLLPVHRGVLNGAPFSTDANFEEIMRATTVGRHLPTSPIWGHLESSLVRAFGLIWGALKGSEFQMKVKKDLLRRHLEPLANRFERMLSMF